MLNESQLEHLVQKAAYQRHCPSNQALSDYEAQWLDAAEAKQLAFHIGQCAHCQTKLAHLTQFLTILEPVVAKTPSITWIEQVGYRWAKLKEGGQILIKLLGGTSAPTGTLAPIPVRGAGAKDDMVLRHITLSHEETNVADIKATVLQDAENKDSCILVIQVDVRERWPDTEGIQVQATALDWHQSGVTSESGEIMFQQIPRTIIDDLSLTIANFD